jgi:hypothetical protein
MLNFKFQIKVIEYAHKRHVKDFNKRLEEQYKIAARVFIREAVKHVPIYTGMSRASFLPLARFLGENLVINPAPNVRTSAKKNFREGVKRGRFKFVVSDTGLATFEFNTRVAHYRINEFLDATKYRNPKTKQPYFRLKTPGPYLSLRLAQRAYNDYVRREIPRKLPKIRRFISLKGTNLVRAGFARF